MAQLDLTGTIVGADQALFSRWTNHGGLLIEADAPRRDFVGTIVTMGVALGVVVFALQTLLHILGLVLFDPQPVFLNLDADDGLFAWVSGSLTFAGAFSSLLLAGFRPERRTFLLLAACLAWLSLDDALAIHERTGDAYFGLDPELQAGRFVWPVLFFPILAATALLLWLVARDSPRPAGAALRIGLLLLVAAVCLEAASTLLFQFDWGPGSKPYEGEVVLEEGLETGGICLVVSALAALAYAGLLRPGSGRASA